MAIRRFVWPFPAELVRYPVGKIPMTINYSKQISLFLTLGLLMILASGCGFVGSEHYSSYDPPGFFSGIWHGMVAPYTLILRVIFETKFYAMPNTGWFYDFGFLLGIILSIPFGWLAALIAIPCHITGFSLLSIINTLITAVFASLIDAFTKG